jgi:hypothetical protein
VSPDHKDAIRQVIEACGNISTSGEINLKYGKGEFQFAVLCLAKVDLSGLDYYRKRHFLPLEKLDCHQQCVYTNHMKSWSTEIKNTTKFGEIELNGKLQPEDASRLSTEISKYHDVHVKAFIEALGQKPPTQLESKTDIKWLLMEYIARWMRETHEESTKKEMAVILIALHIKYNRKSVEKYGERVRFKKLARELDLQSI